MTVIHTQFNVNQTGFNVWWTVEIPFFLKNNVNPWQSAETIGFMWTVDKYPTVDPMHKYHYNTKDNRWMNKSYSDVYISVIVERVMIYDWNSTAENTGHIQTKNIKREDSKTPIIMAFRFLCFLPESGMYVQVWKFSFISIQKSTLLALYTQR